MKIYKLPRKSKPWPVLRLLLVQSTRRTFWLQLLQRCRASRGDRRSSAIGVAEDTRAPEQLQTPPISIPPAVGICDEVTPADDAENEDSKEEAKTEPAVELLERAEEQQVDTWKAIALRLSGLTTAAYLLGNALLFAFYMCPLLYRIISHSATSFVADTKYYDDYLYFYK